MKDEPQQLNSSERGYMKPSDIVDHTDACPKCVEAGNDTAGDNLAVYQDGHAHCFACGYHVNVQEEPADFTTTQIVPWRGITRETMEKYGITAKVNNDEIERFYFPFPSGGYLSRDPRLANKRAAIRYHGERNEGELFGADKFSAGSSNSITIVEGVAGGDAPSMFQLLGGKYPVVAIRSASSARADCTAFYEYLDSFEKIILCLDSDAAGEQATKEITKLFNFNKVYVVNLTKHSDANDYLQAGDGEELKRAWWNAKRVMPVTITANYEDIDKLIDGDEIVTAGNYPWRRLQEMTYGYRPGEFVLLKAPEGVGKTEFLRSLEYYGLQQDDANIGIVHLEESQVRAVKGLVGYHLKQPVHFPDSPIDNGQIKEAYRELSHRNDRIHYYSHFGSDDPRVILNTIQFLAGACGCKRIYLDHITMVVSGLDENDERKQLDFISTRLKMLAENLGFTLFAISHVNDAGQTRGSRNISKVADLSISLSRDLTNTNEDERNITYLTVEKNRFTGNTGPAGSLFFDKPTFMLMDNEARIKLPPVENAA
ncbi:MAG: DnaB-like helicase C-terminal domain-containing protein [bacterium]